MFPRSWFGVPWFAAPYWRHRSTQPPPGPGPDPEPGPDPGPDLLVREGIGLWHLPPRSTGWRPGTRGEVWRGASRPVVWRVPSR
jgi:hypothetical protein